MWACHAKNPHVSQCSCFTISPVVYVKNLVTPLKGFKMLLFNLLVFLLSLNEVMVYSDAQNCKKGMKTDKKIFFFVLVNNVEFYFFFFCGFFSWRASSAIVWLGCCFFLQLVGERLNGKKCVPCEVGTFQDKEDYTQTCITCRKCEEGMS